MNRMDFGGCLFSRDSSEPPSPASATVSVGPQCGNIGVRPFRLSSHLTHLFLNLPKAKQAVCGCDVQSAGDSRRSLLTCSSQQCWTAAVAAARGVDSAHGGVDRVGLTANKHRDAAKPTALISDNQIDIRF